MAEVVSTSEVDTSKVYTQEDSLWKMWTDTPPRDWGELREVMEKWSNIQPDDALDHIRVVRKKAYEIFPWPCLALFSFVNFSVSEHPFYENVLHRLRDQNQTFLDVGCCFAQDLRKLAFEGAPTENLYAADLHQQFIDYGFEMFNDKDKMKATYVAGNILNDPSEDKSLASLEGKLDMIQASHFLHVFSWEDSVTALTRMTQFLKPDSKDAVIFGRQLGSADAGTYVKAEPSGEMRGKFRHTPATFKKFFEEVSTKTGRKWEVNVTAAPMPAIHVEQFPLLKKREILSFEAHRV